MLCSPKPMFGMKGHWVALEIELEGEGTEQTNRTGFERELMNAY